MVDNASCHKVPDAVVAPLPSPAASPGEAPQLEAAETMLPCQMLEGSRADCKPLSTAPGAMQPMAASVSLHFIPHLPASFLP